MSVLDLLTGRPTVEFLDATGDPGLVALADAVPALRAAYVTLGFRPLGFLAARSESQAQVVEVLASPDRSALAIPQLYAGRPFDVIRSILDDGTIVDTGAHATAFPPSEAWLNHPASGYVRTRLHAGTPAEVWARHGATVAEVCTRRQTMPALHDHVDVYVTLCRRSSRITSSRRQFAVCAAALSATLVAFVLPARRAVLSAAYLSPVAYALAYRLACLLPLSPPRPVRTLHGLD